MLSIFLTLTFFFRFFCCIFSVDSIWTSIASTHRDSCIKKATYCGAAPTQNVHKTERNGEKNKRKKDMKYVYNEYNSDYRLILFCCVHLTDTSRHTFSFKILLIDLFLSIRLHLFHYLLQKIGLFPYEWIELWMNTFN